jgi:hypothetical protein
MISRKVEKHGASMIPLLSEECRRRFTVSLVTLLLSGNIAISLITAHDRASACSRLFSQQHRWFRRSILLAVQR